MIRNFCFAAMVCAMPGIVHAESVFFRDGNIVEGKVAKETDALIEIVTASGDNKTIKRADIIRVLYQNTYKDRRFLTKMDGSILKVYLVDEDGESYIVRDELFSAKEETIPKKDVDSISKRKAPMAVSITRTGYYMRGFIPGWAQFHSDHFASGAIMGFSFIGSVTWAVLSNRTYNSSKDKYDTTASRVNYDKAKKDSKPAMYSLILTGTVYALNWIDVFFISRPAFASSTASLQSGMTQFGCNLIPDSGLPSSNFSDGMRAEFSVSYNF
jgi:hypothetical protein